MPEAGPFLVPVMVDSWGHVTQEGMDLHPCCCYPCAPVSMLGPCTPRGLLVVSEKAAVRLRSGLGGLGPSLLHCTPVLLRSCKSLFLTHFLMAFHSPQDTNPFLVREDFQSVVG